MSWTYPLGYLCWYLGYVIDNNDVHNLYEVFVNETTENIENASVNIYIVARIVFPEVSASVWLT